MTKGKWYVMEFQHGNFIHVVPIMLRSEEMAGAERIIDAMKIPMYDGYENLINIDFSTPYSTKKECQAHFFKPRITTKPSGTDGVTED